MADKPGFPRKEWIRKEGAGVVDGREGRGKIEHARGCSSSLSYVIHCCARRRRHCSHVFFRGEREIIRLKGGSALSLSLSLFLSLVSPLLSHPPFRKKLSTTSTSKPNPSLQSRYPVLLSPLAAWPAPRPETATEDEMTPRRHFPIRPTEACMLFAIPSHGLRLPQVSKYLCLKLCPCCIIKRQ